MSIYREKRKGRFVGSLVLDTTFRGVGRIKVATGCRDTPKGRDTAEKMEQMLHHLATDGGRRDLVRAIYDGDLELADIFPVYRRGGWKQLPSAEELRRAFPVTRKRGAGAKLRARLGAVGKWLPTYRTSKGTVSPAHIKRYRRCFEQLEKLKPQAKVADLPGLVRQYRERCEAAGTHREFQMAKVAVQTFLRSAIGRNKSLLWADVADVPTLLPGEGKSEKREGRTFAPAEARVIRERLGPKHGRQWWSMCTTGMMPDEYFGRKFREHPDRHEIVGTKRRVGDGTKQGKRWRLVPKVGPIVGPFTEAEAFLEACRALGDDMFGGNVRPYDARHTFAHWLKLAGIDSARRDVYRGHSAKSMEELYERPDRVTRFLADDAVAMAEVIGPEPDPVLRVVAGGAA